MQEPAATVEEGGHHDAVSGAAALEHSAEPKGRVMKFTYASGARPLEGFTVKRGIGAGGFGEVYYATSDAGKEVALKHIQRNLDIELRGVGQCLNLKHPHLVSLYDIKYDEGGEGWVVMEYVAGESLKDVVDRNPNGLPIDTVHLWLKGIAAGVACLHDHGIVHRDLKPGNIFDDDGIVKIGDYGLSKFISVSRRSGNTESVGTCHYMAPEIGRGIYGREIDVYALGIILFEMLTGRVPFEGESTQEIMMKHLTAEPDLTGVPQPYAGVIAKALAKDPEQRISSVGEFLQLLGLESETPGDVTYTAVSHAGGAAPDPPQPAKRDEPDLIITDSNASNADMVFGPVESIPKAEVVAAAAAPPVRNAAVRRAALQNAAVPPQPMRREPVGQAIRDGWGTSRDWWHNAPGGAVGKFILLVVAIFLVVTNASWLLPFALVLGIIYLVYRAIWALVVDTREQDSERSHKAGHANDAHRRRHGRRRRRVASPRQRQEWLRGYLGSRPFYERCGELTGSMLMAAFVAGVLGILMMIVGGHEKMSGQFYDWGPFYAWFVVTATVGAWAVLIPAKMWEGRDDAITGRAKGPRGEQVLRRFTMLVLGLVVGWMAFGLVNLFPAGEIELSMKKFFWHDLVPVNMWTSMFAGSTPLLPAYLAYFAGTYAILRWWRQGDPLRATRLSLWTIAVVVGCAVVLPFPQPWGFMLVMTISLAVQLSTPWLSPPRRAEVVRAMEGT